jgi:hypothetical protein
MTTEQIEQFLSVNADKIAPEDMDTIRERLANADQGAATAAFSNLKSPTIALILAILTVWDRLYLGEIGMGICKWFTCGGCGIWWLIDIFTAKKRAQQINLNKILEQI